MKECVARIRQSYIYWLWKQLHAVSQSLTGKWLQIKLTIVKLSVLSVTSAGHSALLTSIILPIPSGVTPYKCHTGSSHLCPAAASNTHVCSSYGHSPLPIEWHYFEKVLEFTFSLSMVNTVVQQLPCRYFLNTKMLQGQCFEKSVSDIFIRLTVLSLCKDSAFWTCVLVSAHLHQLASGSHCPCFGSILGFVRAPLGSTFGSVFLNMERACSISSQLQAAVCLSRPLWCLSDWCSKKTHIVLKKIH